MDCLCCCASKISNRQAYLRQLTSSDPALLVLNQKLGPRRSIDDNVIKQIPHRCSPFHGPANHIRCLSTIIFASSLLPITISKITMDHFVLPTLLTTSPYFPLLRPIWRQRLAAAIRPVPGRQVQGLREISNGHG